MKERLLQLIEFLQTNVSQFEKSISVSNGAIRNAMGRNRGLNSDVLSKILDVYPNISPDWLILGKGEMLRKNNPKNTALATAMQPMPCSGGTDDGTSAALLKIMASQQDTILTLSQTIASLTK